MIKSRKICSEIIEPFLHFLSLEKSIRASAQSLQILWTFLEQAATHVYVIYTKVILIMRFSCNDLTIFLVDKYYSLLKRFKQQAKFAACLARIQFEIPRAIFE